MEDEDSDETLMACVADGDTGAFRCLAARHTSRALALALRMTGSPDDAEEVVQDALMRVWVSAPRWQPTAAFTTWFHRIVVNRCLDRLRQRPAQPLELADEVPDPAVDALTAVARRQEDEELAAAVAALPDRQRAALVLTYYEGLGAAQAAAVLGTSVGAVEGLLVRARRFLRDRLNKGA